MVKQEPRVYQQQCIDRAIQQNTVVSLKTGSGKTLVAVGDTKNVSPILGPKRNDFCFDGLVLKGLLDVSGGGMLYQWG